MNEQELKADLIEIVETGAFKTEHLFQFGGGVLGVLKLKASRSEGNFKTETGEEYFFSKPSIWKSNYEWRDNTSLLGRAVPKGKLSRAFIIDFQGTAYGLLPGGSKLRSWRIVSTSGEDLCEFIPRGAFKRGARVRIGAEIQVGLLGFCYCLVTKRWQEQSS